MDTLNRILDLLKKQGKGQIELAEALGIHKNNVSDWKAGRSKSYTKYLYQIADFLGTTPEYLRGETDVVQNVNVKGNYNAVGNTNSNITINAEEFTEQESELLKAFRALSALNKAKALIYVSELRE